VEVVTLWRWWWKVVVGGGYAEHAASMAMDGHHENSPVSIQERMHAMQSHRPQPITTTTSLKTLMRTRVGMPHASWVTCLADSWWNDEWLSRVRVRRRWHEKQHGFFPGTSGHLGSPRLCSRHLLRHTQGDIMAPSVPNRRRRNIPTCAHKLRRACY
jgi:hypothetical protein